MKPADRKLVLEKLFSLNRFVAELEPDLRVSLKEFLRDPMRQRAIERLFQVIVECAADINTIVLTTLKHPPADSARESYRAVNELGALAAAITRRFKENYVPKRNFIVHLYEKVEPHDLYYSAQRLIKDAREYARQMGHFIDTLPNNS